MVGSQLIDDDENGDEEERKLFEGMGGVWGGMRGSKDE